MLTPVLYREVPQKGEGGIWERPPPANEDRFLAVFTQYGHENSHLRDFSTLADAKAWLEQKMKAVM